MRTTLTLTLVLLLSLPLLRAFNSGAIRKTKARANSFFEENMETELFEEVLSLSKQYGWSCFFEDAGPLSEGVIEKLLKDEDATSLRGTRECTNESDSDGGIKLDDSIHDSNGSKSKGNQSLMSPGSSDEAGNEKMDDDSDDDDFLNESVFDIIRRNKALKGNKGTAAEKKSSSHFLKENMPPLSGPPSPAGGAGAGGGNGGEPPPKRGAAARTPLTAGAPRRRRRVVEEEEEEPAGGGGGGSGGGGASEKEDVQVFDGEIHKLQEHTINLFTSSDDEAGHSNIMTMNRGDAVSDLCEDLNTITLLEDSSDDSFEDFQKPPRWHTPGRKKNGVGTQRRKDGFTAPAETIDISSSDDGKGGNATASTATSVTRREPSDKARNKPARGRKKQQADHPNAIIAPADQKDLNGTRKCSSLLINKRKEAEPVDLMKKAEISRKRFTKQREALAKVYFAQFNQKVFGNELPSDLEITWNKRLQSTAGLTKTKRDPTGARKAQVDLSTKLLDTDSKLRSTLVHELCHAAQWLIDGSLRPPHGPGFRRWADKVEKVYPDIEVTTCHQYEVHYKFRWSCTNELCKRTIGRHRRCIDVKRQVCGKCRGKLVYLGEFLPSGETKGEKEPSGWSLFLKQHAADVKQHMKGASHRDVMKKLSAMYKKSGKSNNSN